jgi:hypothetical protein
MMSSRLFRASLSSALLASASVIAVDAARAETDITTALTGPVATATANSSGADSIVIESNGTITLAGVSGVTAAATMNSNNFLTNDGGITITDTSNITALLALGGEAQPITTISVSDATPATTIPLTSGSGRYGIAVTGSGALGGSVVNSGGTITVLGDGSAGIYIAPGTGLTGGIVNSGTISVTGSDYYGSPPGSSATGSYANPSYGIAVEAPITGYVPGSSNVSISITGNVTAFGAGNFTAANPAGASALYIAPSSPVAGQIYIESTVQSNAYYNGGQDTGRPAVINLTQMSAKNLQQAGSAILIQSNVGGGVLLDASSTVAASVVTLGSAPTLQIGGPAGSSTEIGAGANGAGLYINANSAYTASITANGIYDNINATAIQVGGLGGTAKIDGGINNLGTISATAYAANATAISYRAGALTTTLTNSGTIEAIVSYGQNGNINTGGTATAILDAAGALSKITNTGAIVASSASGSAIAMNFTGSTNPVSVLQSPSGTVNAPSITGDILFGSGASSLELDAGTLAGNVSYGAGADTLTLTNGVQMTSAITQQSGGTLALNVASGHLVNTSLTNLNLSSLTLGATGQVDFAVDPVHGVNGSATVLGAVAISSGAKVGIDLLSKLTAPETVTLIQTDTAGALAGQPTVSLGQIPYFYTASLTTNPAAGTISLGINDRAFAQTGLPGSAGAYSAIFTTYNNDPGIFNTFNNAITQPQFKSVYQQVLPNYSGGLFEMLSEGAGALVEAQANNQVVQRGDRSGGWAQQIGFGATQNSSRAPGYYGGGLGFAFGWENPASPISTIGYSVAYMRGSVSDENGGPNNQQIGTLYTAGVYWRETDGDFHANASFNAGIAELGSNRNFDGNYFDGTTFARNASSHWTGGMGNAHLGLDYEQALGDDYYIRPSISGDYFMLYEGAHGDHNGGSALDLNYASNFGKQGSATGALTFGTRIGEGFIWRPELTVGYKDVFGGPSDTVAQFVSGGSSFTLTPPDQKGGALAKIGVHGGDKYTDIAFEAGGEDRGDYKALSGQLVARFNF